ncbi:MAG TPA: type IX secretion system membrane protein PorP/SprF [Bacteroidales bacterium]|nr:type IX secretion system membrane protein PorP/SprF [Bacteroidales bacterium]HPS16912.1 type IX secretion system membrane protein PorP/SprF [Bacteroidales bacterium]
MKKIFTTIMFLVAIVLSGFSQNDIQFSNYMFSEITYNPAMAGISGTLDATLLTRQQWTGFDQAPQTQLLSANTYVDKMSGGVGLNMIIDKLGYENSVNFKLMYAYQMFLNESSRLSFGLGFGMLNKGLKGNELIYDDMNDPNGIYVNDTKTKPDFDFGVAYNTNKLCIGASVTHIEKPIDKATALQVPRHYYVYAKYKIKASEKLNIIPSVKFKSAGFISQVDISALAFYANRFWVGATVRPGDAIVGLLGVDITRNIRIGYSYDANMGAIKSYSGGSHEILLMASFDVSKKVIPTKTPRFFN